MNICDKIKSILIFNRIQIKEFAEILNTKTNTNKYSAANLSAKLLRDGISYKEAEMMLNVLGYEIEIVEKRPPWFP